VPALVRSHVFHLPLQCLRLYILMRLIFQYSACACTFSCVSSSITMPALVHSHALDLHYNACACTFSCASSFITMPVLVHPHALHLPLQCLRLYVLMCLFFQYSACACTFSCASSSITMPALLRSHVLNLPVQCLRLYVLMRFIFQYNECACTPLRLQSCASCLLCIMFKRCSLFCSSFLALHLFLCIPPRVAIRFFISLRCTTECWAR